MSNSMNGYCGWVDQNGQITSNGNFTCTYANTGNYTVGYSDEVTNPSVVVSLTGPTPGMSYVLNAYAGGFTLYIYGENLVPIDSSFNFIVAEL